ncbi:MAG: MerR family transcriptional regulator [Acidimicrobiales bacterium]
MRATVGPTFTMSEVVARTGIAPSTIRYYIATGLVPPGYRLAPNRHLYDERHVESLRLVHLLKERRQLPLASIRKILPELLELPADGAFRPEMWEQLVEARARSSAKTSPAARLLEAGVDAFTRRGYAEVRVDDVCQAAKIAKGSFYRHFSSKEELFFAAAREVADAAGRQFLAAESEKTLLPPDEALAILTESLEPNLALLLDLMALAAQRRPGHGRVLREIFTYLYRTVRSRVLPVAGAGGLPGVGGAGVAEEVLERALVAGIRRVVVSPLLDRELFPGESAL